MPPGSGAVRLADRQAGPGDAAPQRAAPGHRLLCVGAGGRLTDWHVACALRAEKLWMGGVYCPSADTAPVKGNAPDHRPVLLTGHSAPRRSHRATSKVAVDQGVIRQRDCEGLLKRGLRRPPRPRGLGRTCKRRPASAAEPPPPGHADACGRGGAAVADEDKDEDEDTLLPPPCAARPSPPAPIALDSEGNIQLDLPRLRTPHLREPPFCPPRHTDCSPLRGMEPRPPSLATPQHARHLSGHRCVTSTGVDAEQGPS